MLRRESNMTTGCLLTAFFTLLVVSFKFTDGQILPPDPIVDTINGQLIGRRGLYNGSVYEAYLGVPFAEPPVGDLRWKKPVPAAPWTGLWNATEFSIHCTHLVATFYPFIGMGGESGEDCLYLNIWIPRGVKANEGKKLPVMVWIYGGGFNLGTGEMYPGEALALHGDVIVMNFNYRLSSLGFISTGDDEAPGNYGLWDMQLVLEWVQINIGAFNGDPTKVTVFGQSAGGCAVSHAMISPYTQNLFNNAIAVSGGATADFGLTEQSLETAILLGDLMNCTAYNSQELIECLREKDAHEVDFWGMIGTSMASGKSANFQPVVDGDFIPRKPADSFKMGEGKHINFMTGSTYQDSAGFIIGNPIALPFLGDKNNVAWENDTMWQNARLTFGWTLNADELFHEMIRMYPDIDSPDNYTRTIALTAAYTDLTFGAPGNWEAQRHSEAGGPGKTFQYQFRHRQSFLVGYPSWIEGSHLDDIYSFLGEPYFQFFRRLYLREEFDEVDLQISSTLMNYYSNFAHSGDPNVGPFKPALEWEEFNTAEQKYMLQAPRFEMRSFYDNNEVDLYRFWIDDFKPMMIYPPTATFPPRPEGDDEFKFLASRRSFTEEDVERAVDAVKDSLLMVIPDPDAWDVIESTIDRYVSERRDGWKRDEL